MTDNNNNTLSRKMIQESAKNTFSTNTTIGEKIGKLHGIGDDKETGNMHSNNNTLLEIIEE